MSSCLLRLTFPKNGLTGDIYKASRYASISFLTVCLATATLAKDTTEIGVGCREDSQRSKGNEWTSQRKMSSQTNELIHVDFEVFGTVQGVFFRKNTQDQGTKLGLRGFCRNTRAGTVAGSVEGFRPAVEKMKHWLQYTGSPMSSISKAVFKNEKVIDEYSFPPGFDIARTA